jgi:hypothetical protein
VKVVNLVIRRDLVMEVHTVLLVAVKHPADFFVLRTTYFNDAKNKKEHAI